MINENLTSEFNGLTRYEKNNNYEEHRGKFEHIAEFLMYDTSKDFDGDYRSNNTCKLWTGYVLAIKYALEEHHIKVGSNMIIKKVSKLKSGDIVTAIDSKTSYVVSAIGSHVAYFEGEKFGQNIHTIQHYIDRGLVEVTRMAT